jgi:hypothetical protein
VKYYRRDCTCLERDAAQTCDNKEPLLDLPLSFSLLYQQAATPVNTTRNLSTTHARVSTSPIYSARDTRALSQNFKSSGEALWPSSGGRSGKARMRTTTARLTSLPSRFARSSTTTFPRTRSSLATGRSKTVTFTSRPPSLSRPSTSFRTFVSRGILRSLLSRPVEKASARNVKLTAELRDERAKRDDDRTKFQSKLDHVGKEMSGLQLKTTKFELEAILSKRKVTAAEQQAVEEQAGRERAEQRVEELLQELKGLRLTQY